MRALLAAALGLLGWPAANACDEAADSTRIAVAGGSITEIVYFLGAEARLVAVDTTSNFPAAAEALPSIGYVRALSAEGLLSLEPTLVLGENDMGPPEVMAALERTGLPIVRVAEVHTAAGIVAKVRCVAAILGLADHAEALIEAQLAPAVAALAALAPSATRAVVLLGIRDGAPIGAGTDTSAHGVLAMAGAQNALADFEGWKPVSLEAMANGGADFVVMPKRGATAAGGAAAVLRHPAIAPSLRGREDRLILMDGMALLGFGPRTLQAALELAMRLGTRASPAN